ncbi:keratin-associated protein 29-1-like [Littorina saxatilis]|uniref:keratin-associated protein 29-1-like n=1 Tax=Littorina saxatilis TaxID=31220 RepID=UPI0038B56F13
MFGAAIFSALLAVTSAQGFPPTLPSTCAATLCLRGTICREVLNPRTGVVSGQCLNSVPQSGNVCPQRGNPLLIGSGYGGVSVVSCGRSPNRINCPPNYFCNIAPNDIFAVCCQRNGPTQPPTQKPGQCPVTQPGSVGICASNCRSDSDCQGAQKCCRNPCGAQTCQNPAQTRPSCDYVRCGPGQTCVLKQVQCIRAPCYPQPVCEPSVVTKPGTCPSQTLTGSRQCGSPCRSDGDCPGYNKCCRSFYCGQTCQQPYQQPQTITCANVRCSAGDVCRETPAQCYRAPCPTKPVCTKRVIVTPGGRCPLFAGYVDPSCYRRDQCASGNGYSGCPRGTLCCSTRCGRQCVRPQY